MTNASHYIEHHHHHHHEHHHGHHHHHHASGTVLILSFAITIGFAVVELIGGWLANSLALLSDAGHMASDAISLALAAFAAWLSKKPPSPKHSYGLLRAEVVAALVNGIFMCIVVTGIFIEAIDRFMHPREVQGGTVMLIAGAGLLVNIVVAYVLSRGEENLNTRGALLHVLGDLLGSVAALVAGAVIYFTQWQLIDPLLSILICLLILVSTYRLLRDVLLVIMEGVPTHLDLNEVGNAMASLENVQSVHDLHIWTVSSGMVALSAHVRVADISQWQNVLAEATKLLHDKYDIEHITLQPESSTQYVMIDTITRS